MCACLSGPTGIVFRAENNQCFGGACIFQGNHFVGNLIRNGATSGATNAIFLNTFAYPAWDSNNVRGTVDQCAQFEELLCLKLPQLA